MKIILFDMMDTLIHEPYFLAIQRLLPEDLDAKTYFQWRDGPAYVAFERGDVGEYEHFRQFYLPDTPPELMARFPKPERVKKELLRSLKYIEGIPELLARLKSRGASGGTELRLGVASNYSIWYQEMLSRLREIREHMDYLFYSCELAARKPDAVFYERIFAGLQRDFPDLRPADVFFTDDRPENIAAAEALGWTAHLMELDALALGAAVDRFLGV